MTLSLEIEAQTSIQGGSTMGHQGTTFDPVLSSYGVLEAWDARYGVTKNVGSSNVSGWAGIQGSSHRWSFFSSTNAVWVPTFTTNNFPAINFPIGQTNLLRCDSLATALNTSRGFTVSVLLCAENVGVAMNPFCLGSSASTNNNSPTFRLAPHLATQTSGGVGFTFNTNSNFGNYTTWTGGAATNGYVWITGGFSNQVIFGIQNLLGSQTTLSGGGTFTADRATLGGRLDGFGATDRYTLKWPGLISMVVVATNYLTGSSLTNYVDYLDKTYSGGFYKTYN
jgi:hypothetical protein